MIKKEYPDEGEFVVGTVTKVQNYGAFVTLDE
ncbi:MAG: translation initiation factor IF-2 subunit alpha, partial [Thermoplasmatota archaeon]